MRVTQKARAETRRRILAAARRRFAGSGFAKTSTRELAADAGIAAGTLFNYFPGKEALAVTLLAEALERGTAAFLERQRGDESLEEALFAHVAAGLRELESCRAWAGEVLETALSPFQRGDAVAGGEALRLRHLETVDALLRAHRPGEEPGFVALHLYWTLYLGVLAFWSNDDSPRQEDTLVVLDESMRLFSASLESSSPQRIRARGSQGDAP